MSKTYSPHPPPLLPRRPRPEGEENKESNRVSLPLQVRLTPLPYFYSTSGNSRAIKSKATPSAQSPRHPVSDVMPVTTLASATHPPLKGLPKTSSPKRQGPPTTLQNHKTIHFRSWGRIPRPLFITFPEEGILGRGREPVKGLRH